MSEGQVIGPECGVAADLLEEEGLVNAAAVLREMAAQVKVVEVPPGAVCVLELPEGRTIDADSHERIRTAWSILVPGTTCCVLEDGMKLRAVLSGIPEKENEHTD